MENHDRETCWAPRNPRLLTRAFSLLCVPASVKSMHLLPATPDYSQASNLSIRANSCSSQQVSLVRGVGAGARSAATPGPQRGPHGTGGAGLACPLQMFAVFRGRAPCPGTVVGVWHGVCSREARVREKQVRTMCYEACRAKRTVSAWPQPVCCGFAPRGLSSPWARSARLSEASRGSSADTVCL